MTINRVLGPQSQVQIRDVLDRTKDDVFYNLNCIQVGSIVSYDPEKNTASLQIEMKRQLPNNEIVDYPVLQDCPVFFLSGGQSFISIPITAGDSCLILFNDRDIDTWWATGSSNVPNTPRAHSLSDAICLVGIRNQSNTVTLKTNAIEIEGADKKVLINSQSANISLNSGLGKIGIKNTATDLKTVLDNLVTTLKTLTVDMSGTPLPVTAASQTALTAIQTQLALLLYMGE